MDEQIRHEMKDDFFNTTLPSAVEAMPHFYNKVLPFQDERFVRVEHLLGKSPRSIDDVGKLLNELHELDARFFGEVLYHSHDLIKAATYTLVYLGKNCIDVESIIHSFGMLAIDPYLEFSLGNEFSKKLKSTYLETVACYLFEWGGISNPDVTPASWHICQNDFSFNVRCLLLEKMNMQPLKNTSFPPVHVMKWFSGESFTENSYLSDLLKIYHEAGINDSDIVGPQNH